MILRLVVLRVGSKFLDNKTVDMIGFPINSELLGMKTNFTEGSISLCNQDSNLQILRLRED